MQGTQCVLFYPADRPETQPALPPALRAEITLPCRAETAAPLAAELHALPPGVRSLEHWLDLNG